MNCNTTHYRANSSSVPGDPTLAELRDLLQQNIGRREIAIFVKEDRARLVADLVPSHALRTQQGALVFWHIEPNDGAPLG